MIHSDCDHIYEILSRAYNTTDCDFRYVLRNILNRGVEEATYLSFQSEGRMREQFRNDKIWLEGIVSDLPSMLDRDGDVLHRHRATIRGAVTLARYLIAIEREQTAGQLDMLTERLRNPRCRESRLTLKAA